MNTLTNLELYKLAYATLIGRFQYEQELNERSVKEIGRENNICLCRMNKMNSQIEELHGLIGELESEV